MTRSLVPCLIGLAALAGTTLATAGQWQALPETAPAPADNPTTEAKVELGKMLYFDTRFSSTGTVSCFSCHNIMEGGDDHRPTSMGVHGQVGGRNAPTVWNAAFLSAQFWAGRAPTLEEHGVGGSGRRRQRVGGLQFAPVEVLLQGAREDAVPALGRSQLLRS